MTEGVSVKSFGAELFIKIVYKSYPVAVCRESLDADASVTRRVVSRIKIHLNVEILRGGSELENEISCRAHVRGKEVCIGFLNTVGRIDGNVRAVRRNGCALYVLHVCILIVYLFRNIRAVHNEYGRLFIGVSTLATTLKRFKSLFLAREESQSRNVYLPVAQLIVAIHKVETDIIDEFAVEKRLAKLFLNVDNVGMPLSVGFGIEIEAAAALRFVVDRIHEEFRPVSRVGGSVPESKELACRHGRRKQVDITVARFAGGRIDGNVASVLG